MAAEAWVHGELRRLGASVPEVVAVDDDRLLGRSFMVTTAMPGRPVPPERPPAAAVIAAGRDLALIGSIAVEGTGFVRRTGAVPPLRGRDGGGPAVLAHGDFDPTHVFRLAASMRASSTSARSAAPSPCTTSRTGRCMRLRITCSPATPRSRRCPAITSGSSPGSRSRSATTSSDGSPVVATSPTKVFSAWASRAPRRHYGSVAVPASTAASPSETSAASASPSTSSTGIRPSAASRLSSVLRRWRNGPLEPRLPAQRRERHPARRAAGREWAGVTPRAASDADLAAQVEQRLVPLVGEPGRRLQFRPADALEDTAGVGVRRGDLLAEREAGDRRRRVRTDAGQGAQLRPLTREPAALDDRCRAAVQVDCAPVVSQPVPFADHIRDLGCGERLDGRPPLQPAEIARQDAGHLRLLQHHL